MTQTLKLRPQDHTVESLLKDHHIGHKNVGSQESWSLVTGSITLKCMICQVYLVLHDRWSLMAVVSLRQIPLYLSSCMDGLKIQGPLYLYTTDSLLQTKQSSKMHCIYYKTQKSSLYLHICLLNSSAKFFKSYHIHVY